MKKLGFSDTDRLPYWLVPEVDLFSPLFLIVDVSVMVAPVTSLTLIIFP